MTDPARPGIAFEAREVVDRYRHRPDYPPGVYARLRTLAPAHGSLLDLGCGTGKIARQLAHHFATVTAVDPSQAMLDRARSLPNGDAGNIVWIRGLAEDTPLGDADFDLIVAAQSIHWMDHARVFPRLRRRMRPPRVLAVVDGDTPFDPPWEADWRRFLAKWIPEISGMAFAPDDREAFFLRYRRFVAIDGDDHVLSAPIRQSVAAVIACQHSRDAFAPSKLGDRLPAFDAELADILRPHAVDGHLTYRIRTRLTWGRIRQEAID